MHQKESLFEHDPNARTSNVLHAMFDSRFRKYLYRTARNSSQSHSGLIFVVRVWAHSFNFSTMPSMSSGGAKFSAAINRDADAMRPDQLGEDLGFFLVLCSIENCRVSNVSGSLRQFFSSVSNRSKSEGRNCDINSAASSK